MQAQPARSALWTCLSLGFPMVKTSSPGTLDLRPKSIGHCAECSLSFLSVFLLLPAPFSSDIQVPNPEVSKV